MALRRDRSADPQRRVLRKDRTGASPFKVGLAVLVLALIIVYFGFTKAIPFTHDFRLNAVFESATSMRIDSPVRIAGVNVGKVTSIKRYKDTDAAEITMEIQDKGLPIHRDAEMKIRPRIFLEGNFFVDLKPGTPAAPKLDDDDAPVPMTQTATPVQFDEVLTALQTDARRDLQDVLDEAGRALADTPDAQQDEGQDPAVQGKSAAQALNATYKYAAPAEIGVAQVNQALLGVQPGDLTKLVSGLQRTAAGLGRNEEQLKDLITNFNTTMAAFASQDANLQATLRLLPPTLTVADETLDSLNAAFPPTRAFAREILPGVRQTPPTIQAAYPWIAQTRALVGEDELQGLSRELSATIPNLAQATDQTIDLLPQVDLVNKCALNVVLPGGDLVVQDGPFTSGVENYKEFWWAMVGLAGESQNFDGNGQYVRFQPSGGPKTVSIGTSKLSGAETLANVPSTPLGTRPRLPDKRPPYRPDVPCYTNKLPDVNGPAAATGPGGTVVSDTTPGAALKSGADQAGDARKGDKSLAEKLADRLNPWRGAGEAGDKPPAKDDAGATGEQAPAKRAGKETVDRGGETSTVAKAGDRG